MGKKNFKGVLFGDDSPAYSADTDSLEDISIDPKEIKIYPELENLIPPLTQEEEANLESSLLEEGCREPLVLWVKEDEHILIDGHNRFRLCMRNNISFRVKSKEFDTILDAKNWMLGNQMSRRNLSPLQMSYLRGLRYETEKLSVGRQKGKNNKTGQNDQINSLTSQKLAEEYSVGEKTIRRDAKFSQGLSRLTGDNQKIRWAILSGQIQAKKATVSDLADQDDEFLELLQAKLNETSNLEKAIKILTELENESSAHVEEVSESQIVYKNLMALLKKIQKSDNSEPKRKERITEAKKLFSEYLKMIS
ncbi:hypothetical protein WJR50_27940 [Catalinimonas sp. 4WD22]|uniref:hypothetical protein n=1 Tax=Catalinimonas locisalis TaxID=3133978 RepID=UPI003101B095